MFKCEQCNACEEEIGMILLYPQDIEKLSRNLDMPQEDFLKYFTYEENGKTYLPAPCPFYDGDGCLIHDFSPQQCIQFPFNQPVPCGDKMMLTINTGCPAGKKLAEKFAINPEKVLV